MDPVAKRPHDFKVAFVHSDKCTASSGVKTDNTPIPANGNRNSFLVFPNSTDAITVEVRDSAGTGWIAAAPAVNQGEYYFDDEYDGEFRVTGSNLNYTVVEY